MGVIEPPTRELDHIKNGLSPEEKADLDSPEVWPELDALLDKGEQLKELVTQLSKLVIKNVGRQ